MFNRDKIIEIMESKGWTKYRLAKEAGIGHSTLHDILSGKKVSPNSNTLSKLATALNVPMDEFFKEDTIENSTNEINEQKNIDNDIIPEKFEDAAQGRAYVKKHKIFASEGFNADRLTDKEILDFANALLEQMRLVSYKYKK